MISALLFFLTAFGAVAQEEVILETGFEGASSLPAGWTQSQISGSATWAIQGGGDSGGSNPSAAHSGSNNATLYIGNSNENKTRLVSPTFNTEGFTNLTLTFWHTQVFWSPDQDELKVFYSSNGGSSWTELAYYAADVSTWTQRTLILPTTSANSRIAFEGNAKYGHGVCLDDIQVTGIPDSISTVSVSATDASASEAGQDTGTWTITRSGNTAGTLSVNYTLGGTATLASDYTVNTPSPIYFAAGETSKVVTLTPVDDTVGGEGNEIATLTLTAGTGYVIIGEAAADISIDDDEGFDLNILIIGSAHSYSEGGESGVVHEKPFNPTTIATHLKQILAQDSNITDSVNVEFEDIYKTKVQTVVYSAGNPHPFTSHCYSLAQHYLWPDGKAARLAKLRGEGANPVWDYIVLCNDPYITANFPGMVAEGVKLIQQEVAKSANPAQVVLLGQWPEITSTFTAAQFNEIAHRVGNSAGLTVVPAGKAWDSYGSKDTSSNHPTPRGEYLAASSIYSKLFNRSAKSSAYDFPSVGDAIADHALSVIQTNAGVAQYSGTYTSFNPFQMKYLTKRVVSYRETGTSTEDRIAQALDRLDDVQRISLTTTGYAGVPGTRWDFNYGRGNDWWEDDKDYEVDQNKFDWIYGFPMHHYDTASAPVTMPYGIDKHYYYATTYEDGTDLGIPYNMIRPGTREPDWPEAVRAIPIRLMWQKMCEVSPGFNPLGDSTHMHPNLNDASAAFMYTLLSGRCPVEPEPAVAKTSTTWMQWLGHKTGYETAWQMSHLTTRAPGFRVLPSATASKTVTPTTKETMTVVFLNPPQSDVTVNISISNANAAIVGSNQLVFTPQNYNIPQNVTVAGIPGSAASEAFNVVFSTVSTDEVYNGLSDSWDYTINRSAPVTLTRVNQTTIQAAASQNLPATINLNTAGATSSNTILAGPSRGTASWSGSNVIYTPSTDFTGVDGFTFATNNAGSLSVGYVEITMSAPVPNGMVSYRGNGSSGGTVPFDTNSYAQNATVTVLGNTGNLTKAASAFDGWNTNADGTGTTYNAGSTFSMGAGGMILYAKWISAPTYTVTYNANVSSTGVVPSNQIKTDGVDLTLATNIGILTKNGYTFAGWNTLANGTGTTYAAGGTYSDNANLTLYAKWTPNTYTVTFNANGGGTPSPTSKLVTNASPYGDLATVSYSGFIFNGWFTATTGGTKILPATIVNITGNQTLYAQWTPGTAYTVSYHANGADSGTVPADHNKIEDVTLTLATNSGGLARTNYTFAGWNTASDGSGTAYAAGSQYTDNAAVTLYARWILNTYTVSYNGNGSTGGTAPPDQTKTHGVNLTLSGADSLVRTGYTFINWNTDANGNGTAYAPDEDYTTDAAITLYAQWTALPTYAVTYNGNGSTGGAAPLNQTKIQGINLILSDAGTLVRTGYAFANWNTEANGSGTAYAVGANYSLDEALTLYAQWTLLPTYTISYNGNNNTGGAVPADQTKIQGTDIILSGPGTLERTGYTFAGWNTAPNGGGSSYAAGATYTADSAETLHAQWTINTYAVSYDANGSTSGTAPTTQAKTYNVNLTLSGAGSLIKTGYSFMGWNTAADGSGIDYAANTTYSTNAPLALYAKWDRLPTVAALNPTNGATGASPSGDLTITFSENIAFGTGAITLRQSDGTLIESFDVAPPPASLTLSGTTVTLNPTSDLAVGGTYYVEIDATAIDDLAGNSFAGFSGSGTWSFTILPQILADSYLTGLDVAAPAPLYSSLNFPSILDGPLTGSSILTHSGFFGSQLSLVHNGASNTFTGNITVNSGTLRIAGNPFAAVGSQQGFTAPSMTSSDTITIREGGTLAIDDNAFTSGYVANRFGTAGAGNRPTVNLTGGALSLNGLNNASSSVQSLGALTATSGYSQVTINRNSNGNPTLAFDSLSISKGAVVNFYSAALGTGTNDARITFGTAPTMINNIIAGAKVWNPATAGVGDFATYGANGVTAFTAYDVTSNDINTGTSATTNFAMTVATTPVTLTVDRAVNSLNYRANGGTWSLGTFKLTLTSGMFLRNGTNSALTINNGTLTAGNGTDAINLHIFTAQQNVTIDAVIADNASSVVTLVKSHGNQLTVSGGANNTYTGGTYVVDGTLATGNVANRAYLGTGKVTVDGTSQLTLGNIGATSNSTGDDYTVVNGARIAIASGTNGAYTSNDTFNIGAGSFITGNSASGQGLASLTRGVNITLAEDAIIGHDYILITALNLTTGTIQNLGTNADLYYGFNAPSNQANAGAVINIGTGTAFKGLSLFGGNGTFDLGTINVASGTTDVYIKTNGANTAAPATMTLGDTFFATGGPVMTLAGDARTVNVNVLGSLRLNDTAGTYGNTGTGHIVRFVSTAGSTLLVNQAAGMGSTSVASALVQNGGSLTIGNTAALNGAVTVEAGGRLVASQALGLTGSGTLTFNEDSILDITNATGFSDSQASAASVAAGTIVRVYNSAQPGTASATLDSFLGSKSPIYQLNGDIDVPEPVAAGTTTLTLNKNGSGVGGILTNGLASTFFRNNVNGQVTIGANGGVIAATSNTELQVQETIVGTGVTLTIGTTAIIDGAPKLGSVAFGSAVGSNSYTGETIINAGSLRTGYNDVLGATTNQITINTGGTLNVNGTSQTVGNLTGTGGAITLGNGTLTIGQGDNGGGDYQGSIQGSGGKLTKTGTNTITLSGANTYTGITAINAGKLFINGNQTSATGNVTVATNATLGGSGTLGGNTTISAGGKLEFDLNTAAGSHNPLDFVAGKGLTLYGASALTITSGGGASPGIYTLVTGGNNIIGSAPATLNLPVGWAATVSISGSNLLLNVTSTGGPGPVAGFQIAGVPSQALVGTTITGITLTARDATNATATSFSGTVTFGGTAGITGTSANFISGILSGVSITPMTPGSNLTLTVNDSASHTGSATFNVQSLFDDWAGDSGLSGDNAAPEANPDGDTLINLLEFAFGMDPADPVLAPLSYVPNGSTNPGTPVLENTGTIESPSYRAVFARRKDHELAGITYQVQFSANLLYWEASNEVPVILSGANSDAVETASIPFPSTVPLSAAETEHAPPKFFRVAVSGD